MKYEVKKNVPEFNPLVVTLTFESQEEIDEMFGVVNFSPIIRKFPVFRVIFDALDGQFREYEPSWEKMSKHWKD